MEEVGRHSRNESLNTVLVGHAHYEQPTGLQPTHHVPQHDFGACYVLEHVRVVDQIKTGRRQSHGAQVTDDSVLEILFYLLTRL